MLRHDAHEGHIVTSRRRARRDDDRHLLQPVTSRATSSRRGDEHGGDLHDADLLTVEARTCTPRIASCANHLCESAPG